MRTIIKISMFSGLVIMIGGLIGYLQTDHFVILIVGGSLLFILSYMSDSEEKPKQHSQTEVSKQ